MNRLQKKCLIATAGGHLLLILVLVFGSAFFVTHSPKVDNTQVLDVIPATLVDAAFNSGVKNARPPTPTPVITPPTPPQPVPQPPQPQPQPVVTPPPQPQTKPEPVKQPDPEPVKPQKPEPDDDKSPEPAPKPTKPTKSKNEIKVDLTLASRTAPSKADTSAADARREAQKQRQQRLNAINNVISSIKENATSETTVEMPGTGSVSYANYALAVKSIYDRAWTAPSNITSGSVNTKVSVTISRDGKVISARIIERSGDSRVDASVQRALDRVNFIRPFPDGAKETERTFIINFNPQAKQSIG